MDRQSSVSKEEMQRQMAEQQRQIAALQASQGASSAGAPGGGRPKGSQNIQERLTQSKWKGEMKDEEVVHGQGGQWWRADPTADDHGDRSDQVNKLRSMARVRAAFAEPGQKPPVWMRDFPRLVVVGDGNTGKSTVLNRFAEFDFTAVSDGVCTRRPIKLELRDASVANHERIRSKQRPLEAICTVFDYRGGDSLTGKLTEEQEFEFPKIDPTLPGGSCPIRTALRKKVELLASAQDSGAMAAGDAEYTTDELVIRYESPGMIHFDLVDLPGIDNDHPMTESLMRQYINAETLDHTFMLVFQAATRGSTAMKYSICVKLIKDVAEQCQQLGQLDWLQSHCLGTLTMFDRVLLENSPDSSDVYDNKYAKQLADWINCTDHTSQTLKFDWVTSLNPNGEEQLNGMSFHDAAKKEQWFFKNLLQGRHPDVIPRCGMGSFRSVLVKKYEAFATASFVTDAQTPLGPRLAVAKRVFTEVNQDMAEMQEKWGWSADEERYDDPACQREYLRTLLSELLTSSNVTSREQVLVRSEVKKGIKDAKTPGFGGGDLQSKAQLKKPVEDLANFLKGQVVNSSQEWKFMRLPLMAEPVQEAITAFLDQFVEHYDGLLDVELAEAGFIHANGGDKASCVQGLVFFMEKQLVNLAAVVAGLPQIPHHLLVKSPQRALAHTALRTVRVRQAQVSHLQVTDDFHLEESLADPAGSLAPGWKIGSAGSLEPEPQPEPQPEPEPEVADAYGRDLLPKDAILLKINNEPCKTPAGGRVGKQRIDEITEGVAEDDWNVITYVESDRLIADHRADIIMWLVPENLHPDYLTERERFMRHRRGAELIAIVFGDQLRASGDEQHDLFDRRNDRPLVRLDRYRTTEREPEYTGAVLSSPVNVPELAFVSLPGFCCTTGCSEPHDAYCNPCGHATCCWDCLGAQESCPVCNVAISGRFLCYPSNSREEGQRVADYGILAGSADGVTPASTVAAAAKKFMLTDAELSAKKSANKQVVKCMGVGCNTVLQSREKHHCRCCGIKVCTGCCDQRKKLIIETAAEGIPGVKQMIERKFLGQWNFWSSGAPATRLIDELNALSETDKVRPIQLRVSGQTDRTFPSSNFAAKWVEGRQAAVGAARKSGSSGGTAAEDFSWERVCNDCKPDIIGMEMAVQ